MIGGLFTKIDCYLFDGCGAEQDLRKNIAQSLAVEQLRAEVSYHVIDDNKAASLGLSGSPSVFFDGKELQPQESTGFS